MDMRGGRGGGGGGWGFIKQKFYIKNEDWGMRVISKISSKYQKYIQNKTIEARMETKLLKLSLIFVFRATIH